MARRSLSAEARARESCRAYARVYRRRGKLIAQPCEVCGAVDVEMHHRDYRFPLIVRWLCREHHLALEQRVRRKRRGW